MSKNKLLIVDDEVEISEALSIFFRNRGFDVIVENDSEKVVGVVRQEQGIDLIIMDIKMPGLSGIDIFKQIRDMNIEVPVLFLTGSIAWAKYINVLKEYGVQEYHFVDKPVTLNFLLEKVNMILKNREGPFE